MKAINALSKNTKHTHAKTQVIFTYFSPERKSPPCKLISIRLAEVVEGRWLILGSKSNDLKPVTNDQEWRLAA